MIYIGADHAGFATKEAIKKFLLKKKFRVTDCGAHSFDKNDDYPLFAHAVARAVAKKNGSKGILVCGSGQGVCIAANKVNGARAALCWSVETAKDSRNDDDANILCLSARYTEEGLIRTIVDAWLTTPFSALARHKRRIKHIE